MIRSFKSRTSIFIPQFLWVIIIVFVSFPTFFPPTVLGTTPSVFKESEETFFGISGLIVDETRTVVGRNFFETFSAEWSTLSSTTPNIVIGELADPRFGSIISVRIGEAVVFRRLLSPRLADVRSAVDMAIVSLRKTLRRQERVQQELDMY